MKRLRHSKIVYNQEYDVIEEKDLKDKQLYHYDSAITTGLEAEEEKEYHLKNVIENKTKNIFLPKINYEANLRVSLSSWEMGKELIDFKEDIKFPDDLDPFENVFDKETENRISTEFKTKTSTREFFEKLKNDENFEEIKKKVLLINLEEETTPLNCFRKRKIYTPRKNKKYESVVVERLKKLYMEMSLIDSLKKDSVELFEREAEKNLLNREIYRLVELKAENISRSKKKKIIKKRILEEKPQKTVNVIKTCKDLEELRTAFNKLEILRVELGVEKSFINKKSSQEELNNERKIERESEFLKKFFFL